MLHVRFPGHADGHTHILWKGDMPGLSPYRRQRLGRWNLPPLILHHPTAVPCQYISLEDNGVYVSGLTLYFTEGCIVGITTHGATTHRHFGSRDACAVHFPIHPGERIIKIRSRPSLLVRTDVILVCTTAPP